MLWGQMQLPGGILSLDDSVEAGRAAPHPLRPLCCRYNRPSFKGSPTYPPSMPWEDPRWLQK
jgi:hypothetical protein